MAAHRAAAASHAAAMFVALSAAQRQGGGGGGGGADGGLSSHVVAALEARRAVGAATLLQQQGGGADATGLCASFPEVTVVVADVVGFTSLSHALPPEAAQRLLSRLWSKLDGLCDAHGLFKVRNRI